MSRSEPSDPYSDKELPKTSSLHRGHLRRTMDSMSFATLRRFASSVFIFGICCSSKDHNHSVSEAIVGTLITW